MKLDYEIKYTLIESILYFEKIQRRDLIEFVNIILDEHKSIADFKDKIVHLNNNNDLDALCLLGSFYEVGLGVEKDINRALELYRKAAGQENPMAQNNLGYCYQKGIGVPINLKVAIFLYEKSAKQGCALASSNLGFCYQEGIGVQNNCKLAFELLFRAGTQGSIYAQANLASCYANGFGVNPDPKQALKIYQNLADCGFASAQNKLGICYLKGTLGLQKNLKLAVDFFSKAANQGNETALLNLGYCYLNGLGVEANPKKAVSFYRESAAMGVQEAISILAWCEATGFGFDTPPNLHAAIKYNYPSPKCILSLYPREKRLAALMERDSNKESVIEKIFNCTPKVMEELLSCFDVKERADFLLSKCKDGIPTLRKLVHYSFTRVDWRDNNIEFDELFNTLTEEQMLRVLLEPDNQKMNIFSMNNFVCFKKESSMILAGLLSFIPLRFRVDVLCKILLGMPSEILKNFVPHLYYCMPVFSMPLSKKKDDNLGVINEIRDDADGNTILQTLSKVFPQLKVPLIARRILALQKKSQETEKAFYKQLADHAPGNAHIAENKGLMIAANTWFNNKIKPLFEKEFQDYGVQGKKGIKGKSELEAIEIQIRKTILQHIKRSASGEINKFMHDRENSLCEGDAKALAEARKLFNSNDNIAHLAWRCYDKDAPTEGSFGNFFINHSNLSNTAIVYSTKESLVGTDKTNLTQGTASDIIRERAAYYYLVATDPSVPNLEDRTLDFISYVAENRRAYNNNNQGVDRPNCFPGHITKLACIGNKHPHAKLPAGAKQIIHEVMKDIIITSFRTRIKELAKEGKEKKITDLYNALVYLSDANAEEIARGETNEIVMRLEPYTIDLLEIREYFRLSSLPKDQEIIDIINKKLLSELGRTLEPEETVYLELGFENMGGGSIANELTREYQSLTVPVVPTPVAGSGATIKVTDDCKKSREIAAFDTSMLAQYKTTTTAAAPLAETAAVTAAGVATPASAPAPAISATATGTFIKTNKDEKDIKDKKDTISLEILPAVAITARYPVEYGIIPDPISQCGEPHLGRTMLDRLLN